MITLNQYHCSSRHNLYSQPTQPTKSLIELFLIIFFARVHSIYFPPQTTLVTTTTAAAMTATSILTTSQHLPQSKTQFSSPNAQEAFEASSSSFRCVSKMEKITLLGFRVPPRSMPIKIDKFSTPTSHFITDRDG